MPGDRRLHRLHVGEDAVRMLAKGPGGWAGRRRHRDQWLCRWRGPSPTPTPTPTPATTMMATMTTSTKMTTVTTTTTTTKMTNSDPCLAVNLPNARCTECDSWSSERCCEPDYFGMNKISADGCEEMYRERIRDLATFWTSLYLIFRKSFVLTTKTS